MTQSANLGVFARISFLISRIFLVFSLVLAAVCTVNAQTSSGPNVTLNGNHPPEATTMFPAGRANSSAQLNLEVTLQLRNRPALDQLLRDQQDPTSPRYHQWLTSGQFTAQFGPSQQDADSVAQWLTSQGFQVTAASVDERYVRFQGSVADAERAFGTNIMAFGDGSSYSNVTDPMIPARFAGVIGASSRSQQLSPLPRLFASPVLLRRRSGVVDGGPVGVA